MAFSGPGFLHQVTLAGAAQFDGLTLATGLFSWRDAATFGAAAGANDQVPRILVVGYDAAGDAHEVSFLLAQDAAQVAGGRRIRIGGSSIDSAGALLPTLQATQLCGDGLIVPLRDVPTRVPWVFQCISSGKTGDATLTVWATWGLP